MAGSPNAFANTGSIGSRRSSILSEQDHNARPSKRARLSDEAVASISIQCAQADTSLEVDYMILDYVGFQTTKVCFESRDLGHSNRSPRSPRSPSNELAIFDALLAIFKTRYSTHHPDPELRLRILLLRITTLFTQRLTSNPTTPPRSVIDDLRAANDVRARTWIASSGFQFNDISHASRAIGQHPTLSLHDLERNRAHVLQQLGVPAEDEYYEDAFYGTASCISLLELLPLFMEVSAVRRSMDESNLTEQWMKLACEFMLQACLEQYLVVGAQGSDALKEAFAWGYVDGSDENMEVDGIDRLTKVNDSSELNAMFEDEDYETEVDGWKEMRQFYINKLVPRAAFTDLDATSDTLADNLEALSERHPIAEFESALLKFLEAISKSLPDPVLIQLENGKLDGMTEQETQDFLLKCGVGVSRFFDHPTGFKDGVD